MDHDRKRQEQQIACTPWLAAITGMSLGAAIFAGVAFAIKFFGS
jgi:hypothetical protein